MRLWAVICGEWRSGPPDRRGVWKTMGSEEGWSGARATCVVSDHQGKVWIGTSHGGLQCWDNGRFRVLGRENGLGGDVVRGLLVDHIGDLWIALDSPARLQRLHQDQFQTFTQSAKGAIRAHGRRHEGNTLVQDTQDGLLFRLDGPELKNETPHTSSQPAPHSLHASDA